MSRTTKSDRAATLSALALAAAGFALAISIAAWAQAQSTPDLKPQVARIESSLRWLNCREAMRAHPGSVSCLETQP